MFWRRKNFMPLPGFQPWTLQTIASRYSGSRVSLFISQCPAFSMVPPHYRSFTITLRHTTLGGIPLDEWSSHGRDLYPTTHNTHKRDIYTSSGIRTRNLSKRVTADPRGHWDRSYLYLLWNLFWVSP